MINGEDIQTRSPDETADAIAWVSDCFPFYIHHIVKSLKQAGWAGTPDAVEQLVVHQLLDANDPWELNHYRDRIPVYYGPEIELAVLGILDGIAARSAAISINDLLAELKSADTLVSVFTPSRTRQEVLETIFVQRHAMLDDAVERIHESATTGNEPSISNPSPSSRPPNCSKRSPPSTDSRKSPPS